MENQNHQGNYKGTTKMHAKNQDMAFVNDTIDRAKTATPLNRPAKQPK